ncbi:MAG TPA: hypothetical protein VIU61_04470 [Kofleriaceae bacterium]
MKAILPLVLLGGCVEKLPGEVTGTQSIRVEVTSPTNPGGPGKNERLADSARAVTMNLTAIGPDGSADTSLTTDLQVYSQFLGTLTPSLEEPPLKTIRMTNGVANGQTLTLPSTFGPTTIWVDDGQSDSPTYATGTSVTLWYRDPFISDLQKPPDETVNEAMFRSPLETKQIAVNGSKYGDNGRLIVTSIFAQGYTVSDAMCGAGGAPPCTAMAYDHMMVFSFSAPRDQLGRLLLEGQVIDGFTGGVSEFNGLTEIGFPSTTAPEVVDHNPARLPAPAAFDPMWFGPVSDPMGRINLEKNEAAPIAITGATVCPLDDDFDTYKQWKISPSGTAACSDDDSVLSVITSGVISDLDMAKLSSLEGTALPRVVGVLRPVSIGGFNVWIIYPRSPADVTLP